MDILTTEQFAAIENPTPQQVQAWQQHLKATYLSDKIIGEQKQNIMANEDVRVALGFLLAITSLIVGVLALGFTIVSEVGGLIALCAAVVLFFVGLGLMGVYKALAEFLCLD